MSSKVYWKRKTCRLCKDTKLKSILSLGNIEISDFVVKNEIKSKAPLELVQCENCKLVQLRHTVLSEILYQNQYWYKSNINNVIERDLEEISREAIKMKFPEMQIELPKSIFIDIGANDGTLLKYVPNDYYRIGVEPAQNLQKELREHCDEAIEDYWERIDLRKKARIITAIGMFYDSENPNVFIANVKKHLEENGIFIAQMMTLKSMIKNNDVGNICHEHLEYYSYQSLKILYEQNGLEIFKIDANLINGGSYRIFARHYQKGSIDYLEPDVDFDKFKRNIEKNRDETVDFIKKEVARGKKIYAYGASTKGNTILQWYGLNSQFIQGVADKNSEKMGKYMVGTQIPIISEKETRAKADYFFVLPYGFIDSFVKREKEFIKQGGKMFVSTPAFKIYG